MSGDDDTLIPLEAVADDARPLIEAFRAAGSVSFQDTGLAEARSGYVAGCRANGPVHRNGAEVAVEEHRLSGVPCRAYAPATSPSNDTTILFFHGGGWVIGDLDTHDPLCRYLAAASGSTIVAVDYRLAPEHPFPAAHDDAIAAATAILGGLDGGGGDRADPALVRDAERVVVVGDSAGANLAAWVAAASTRGAFAHRLRGQVLLYPVADLTFSFPSHRSITAGFPLTAASMEWFAASYAPDAAVRSHPALSPALHPVAEGQPPAFIATVGLDPLADEGIAFAGRLASAGAAVEHHHLPRHAHGLVTSAGRIATGRRLLERVVGFVEERTA
ncbi:alpha/beta hydrolase [Leucobacter sp. CSA1]|uniref:Alpha/beta hydrolase n=1 Tax=Leucobacter chromiisoli TaxID=2796471 RepID=A0A934UTU2_9MICO|nr:alpha/beta hydrolase [Leucobacter chromiisoli]MBK0417513.1 alpha/beta hydrolase [Leucobacter chromiisoli]